MGEDSSERGPEDAERALRSLRDEIDRGLHLALSERQVENLAGNIVKEEFWKGRISAFLLMKSASDP